MTRHVISVPTPRSTARATHSDTPSAAWPVLGDARPFAPARRAALIALLSVARRTVVGFLVLSLVLLASVQATAQPTGPTTGGAQSPDWLTSSDGLLEIRPFAGAFIPTGPQRAFLKDAVLAGGQLSARLMPALAVTGTFAWTPNNDQLTPGAPTLDVYQYDIGLEARGAGWFQGDGWDFIPFVGLGGGGRTYSYRNLTVASTTNGDGYGSVGATLEYGRLGVRVEGRDYISQFRPLRGQSGNTTNRNDVGLVGGLSIRL